jgi:hypothetical protein
MNSIKARKDALSKINKLNEYKVLTEMENISTAIMLHRKPQY